MNIPKLYSYQEKVKSELVSKMKQGCKRILVVSPTGSGKTVMFSEVIWNAYNKGKKVFIFSHRVEIQEQIADALTAFGVPCGLVSGSHPLDMEQTIQIINVASFRSKKDKLGTPDLCIFDECHHISAGGWNAVVTMYSDVWMLGYTATPERLDGQGLGVTFDIMVEGPSVADLIRMGRLSQYKAFSIPDAIDTSVLKKGGSDYTKKSAAESIKRGQAFGSYVNEYKKHLDGKSALVFAPSIEISQEIAAKFNAEGITAVHLDGKSHANHRRQTMTAFRRKEVKVICNVDLFAEGLDCPGLDGVLLLRPTQSLGLHLQQVGRALRVSEGKEEAIILDFVGNLRRLGLPDDPRKWDLQGKEKRKKREEKEETTPPIRVCPTCFAAQTVRGPKCCYCGEPFNLEAQGLKMIDGELVDAKSQRAKDHEARQKREKAAKLKEEQRGCTTLEEFQELARKMKYSENWAYYKWKAVTKLREKYRR